MLLLFHSWKTWTEDTLVEQSEKMKFNWRRSLKCYDWDYFSISFTHFQCDTKICFALKLKYLSLSLFHSLLLAIAKLNKSISWIKLCRKINSNTKSEGTLFYIIFVHSNGKKKKIKKLRKIALKVLSSFFFSFFCLKLSRVESKGIRRKLAT
jgi:hypothetical protein